MPKYLSVILDVDSTLSGIEGIDWLAARRNATIGEQVAALTAAAMAGERTLDEVYRARLDLVRPTKAELAQLAEEYWRAAAPGARDAIARLTAASVRVEIVTSGLGEAVIPFAARLGLPGSRVHAVPIAFGARGEYSSFDGSAPLCVQGGKRVVAASLGLRKPVLAVGDGVTDAEIRPVADEFAAFTGFVRREPVAAIADYVIGSFAELEQLVLGTGDSA